MKPLLLLSLLFAVSVSAQNNQKLEQMLDTVKSLDYSITPNIVIKHNGGNQAVAWAGKIDTIEISSKGGKVTVKFWCSHQFMASPSKEAVLSKKPVMKKEGDGYFSCSLISGSMTVEKAKNMIRSLYEKPSPCILVIGKPKGTDRKQGKVYVYVNSYSFYSFHL